MPTGFEAGETYTRRADGTRTQNLTANNPPDPAGPTDPAGQPSETSRRRGEHPPALTYDRKRTRYLQGAKVPSERRVASLRVSGPFRRSSASQKEVLRAIVKRPVDNTPFRWKLKASARLG